MRHRETITALTMACLSLTLSFGAGAQTLSGPPLLAALQGGGYVVLMRHGSSPPTPPDAEQADAENVQVERQLDDVGRDSVHAMGEALRGLRIPIGEVLSSPTYRALETVKLARLGDPVTFTQLGDAGQSMTAETSGARGAWLRAKAAEAPAAGKNTFIVTQLPNIMEAYGPSAAGLSDGEALVLHPDGRGDAPIVAHVKIEDWTHLGASP